VKRSSLAKLAAICALWISLGTPLHAQRPWELSFACSANNTYYEEDFMSKILESEFASYHQDIRGNSFTALALNPSITYRARRDLRLPFFVTVEGSVPVVTLKGLETGHKYKPDNAYLVQQEDVEHNLYTGHAIVGWELLPWLQPYVLFDYSVFVTRRMNQLDGTDSGTLVPEKDKDYSETVTSTHLGFGVEGYVSLSDNSLTRLRYRLGYAVPQSSSVVNDLEAFNTDPTGQSTSGYTIAGKIQLDLPLSASSHDTYISFGALALKRYWNGDGFVAKGSGRWPANFAVQAGGFIGVGMFF
jgi:hypothetical protein